MIALLPGPLHLFGTIFDVHTLVYASALMVIGYQGILFAVFARIFAMSQGFLPNNTRIKEIQDHWSLELGLVVGALLVICGVILSVVALLTWGQKGFGPLNYKDTLRVVIPAATMLILGVQTILASFFVSILGIARRPTSRA